MQLVNNIYGSIIHSIVVVYNKEKIIFTIKTIDIQVGQYTIYSAVVYNI